MIFVADESVDRPIVDRLRKESHEVVYVAEMAPGAEDDTVLRLANDRGALLLTADKDFGELVFRQNRAHAGVVLLRLAGLRATDKAALVAEVCREHAPELAGTFSVLSPGAVRIRRLS